MHGSQRLPRRSLSSAEFYRAKHDDIEDDAVIRVAPEAHLLLTRLVTRGEKLRAKHDGDRDDKTQKSKPSVRDLQLLMTPQN